MSLSSRTAERPATAPGQPGAGRRRLGSGGRRRKTALVLAGLLTLGSAAGLMRGLTSCGAAPAGKARPLSVSEAQRLAGMRVQNYRDARVGLRIELGKPGRQTRFAGWIDWERRALSLGVAGPTTESDGLIQAAPGLIAARSADPRLPATKVAAVSRPAPGSASGRAPGKAPGRAPASTPPAGSSGGAVAVREAAEPPARLPTDRWRARPLGAPTGAARPLDTLVSLLFTVAAPKPDAAGPLARSEARWLGRDTVDGVGVDVLLGPAVPPAAPPATRAPRTPAAGTPAVSPTSLAAMGGAVRYWVDGASRLYRFDALFGPDLPVRVELRRDQGRSFALAAPLGGAPITPRAVTVAEGATLAKLRQRDRATGGGRVRITLPTVDGGVRRASGWLDWRATVAYLMIQDPDRPGAAALLRADATGVATRRAPTKAARPNELPPTPPPRDRSWSFAAWADQRDAGGTYDLDLLVNEALSLSARDRDDAAAARRAARWLRADVIGGGTATVYEIPKPVERGTAPGQARLRYWLDRDGVLRRLELRTRSGAFAQLDISPADVPTLGRVPLL